MSSQGLKRGMLRPNHGSSRSPLYLVLGVVAVCGVLAYYYHTTSTAKKIQENQREIQSKKLQHCLIEKTELGSKNEAMRNNEKSLDEQVEKTKKRAEEKENQVKALEEQLGSLKEELNKAKVELGECQKTVEDSKAQIEKLNAKNEDLAKRELEAQKKVEAIQTAAPARDPFRALPGPVLNQRERMNVPQERQENQESENQRVTTNLNRRKALSPAAVHGDQSGVIGAPGQQRLVQDINSTGSSIGKGSRGKEAGSKEMIGTKEENINGGEVKDTEETEESKIRRNPETSRGTDRKDETNTDSTRAELTKPIFGGENNVQTPIENNSLTDNNKSLNRPETDKNANFAEFQRNRLENEKRSNEDTKSQWNRDEKVQLQVPQKLRPANDNNNNDNFEGNQNILGS